MIFLAKAGLGKEDGVQGAALCLETTRPSQEGCCPEMHRVGKQQKGRGGSGVELLACWQRHESL